MKVEITPLTFAANDILQNMFDYNCVWYRLINFPIYVIYNPNMSIINNMLAGLEVSIRCS